VAAVVFGILALVFLLGAGGVTTLYLVDRNTATKKSADQQTQIASLQKQLDDKTDELETKSAELRRTQDDLDDAEAAATECPDAVQKFFEVTRDLILAGKTSSPEATAAAQKMIAACNVHL
jgi:peptidoglycan hydrolase CwlO-like protein